MYTMNKELLLLHMYKMNLFSMASHKTMTSTSCFVGSVLLPVYVCIERNKYSFWWGLILPSLAYTICQLLRIMKEYQTCIFIPLDLIFRVLSSITFICFLFILNFLNWFTSITYILNALTESLHAIFQFLKTKYNVFKH